MLESSGVHAEVYSKWMCMGLAQRMKVFNSWSGAREVPLTPEC